MNTLAKEAIQAALYSKILTPRQRWIVVRRIKSGGLSDEEIQKILRIFANEKKYKEKNYADRLIRWISTLNQLQLKKEIDA